MRLIFTFIGYIICIHSFSQQKVYFKATDGLRITADLYLKDKTLPFILLFHQVGSSRGEYNQIATKLLHLDYNCLAIDLRSGNELNFVQNETAAYAVQHDYGHSLNDCRLDIEAAVKYVLNFNNREVILLGSSFSASLCLLEGKNNDRVNAVIALSPGEFFSPLFIVRDQLKDYSKSVFATANPDEINYVSKLLDLIPDINKNLFKTKKSNDSYGSAVLSNGSKDSQECWLQLSLFFKKIKTEEFGATNISR